MRRVDIGYPKDAKPVIRLRTNHAPVETMTIEEARRLAAELNGVADELEAEEWRRSFGGEATMLGSPP